MSSPYFQRSLASLILVASVLWTTVLNAQNAGDRPPDFELVKFGSEEKIKLSDYAGKIVVLDFFAYWCVPCKRASAELEAGIEKYYEEKKGNPNGVPVAVLGVNIEMGMPKQTAAFIRQAGMQTVANDVDGKLLAQLKGPGTPFIVVIDGTRATLAKPDYRILSKQAGFEGTKKLRDLIDPVKPQKVAGADKNSGLAALDRATGAPVIQKGDVAFEAMVASDIEITTSALSYGRAKGGTEWNLGYTHNTFGEDYRRFEEFDFLGYDERISESSDSGQVGFRQRLGESLTLLGSAGIYRGFTDFRSVWFSTYYKQQFTLEPAYQNPDPHGFSGSSGLRWEYLSAAGFLEAGFFYSNDTIAPGYERNPDTGEVEVGRQQLQTYSPSLRFENILTTRIRTLQELQLTLTTGRDPRYSYRGSINVALGEKWVWRTVGGYTREDPTLRAWFAGSTLEYALSDYWLLNVSGLFYHDTGEIENSLFISTAAPGLVTHQAGVGLRYAGEKSSFALSAAPVFSDYEEVQTGTRPFTNLYRDRTWVQVQASWALEF